MVRAMVHVKRSAEAFEIKHVVGGSIQSELDMSVFILYAFAVEKSELTAQILLLHLCTPSVTSLSPYFTALTSHMRKRSLCVCLHTFK